MDYCNIVVVAGTLAAEPELREFESGSRLVRYLVTVRSEEPRRRVDVLPVTLWDPPPELLAADAGRGRSIWTTGTAQRRFWESATGRRSTVELVADHVEFRDPPPEPVAGAGEGGDDG